MGLTKDEELLIKNYNQDFYEKTGRKLKIELLNKWESICRLEHSLPTTYLVTLICDAVGWDLSTIFVSKKTDDLVLKRNVIYYILKSNGVSFKNIAQYAGHDNHSTIIHALNSFEIKLEQNKYIGGLLKEIMTYINENL